MTIQLDEGIIFPRDAVRFPVELRKPPGMRFDDPATWPRVAGRLELVAGRLLYMPPCADVQQDVAIDGQGVASVWIVLPESMEVLVLDREGESRHGIDSHLPERAELPDLAPAVKQIFAQLLVRAPSSQ